MRNCTGVTLESEITMVVESDKRKRDNIIKQHDVRYAFEDMYEVGHTDKVYDFVNDKLVSVPDVARVQSHDNNGNM